MISADISIDDLIRHYPQAVGFLINKGLPCAVCGEPFWETLAELAHQKGWNQQQIEHLVAEFNQSIAASGNSA